MQIGFNFLLPKKIWQRFIGNQNTRRRRDFIASCHVAGTFETRTQKARAAKNVSLAEGFVLSIFGSGYARLGFRISTWVSCLSVGRRDAHPVRELARDGVIRLLSPLLAASCAT